MRARIISIMVIIALLAGVGIVAAADEVTIQGVSFPTTRLVAGKTLTLNGVACRKALGFVKVYVVGLYLETPTSDPEAIINSEQVKYLYTHYLSGMATAEKLRNGFIEVIHECNPPEQLERNRADIDRYASWLDKDMKPGMTSVTTYVPGVGLTLEYQGIVKGTVANTEFAQMYYRYNVGEKADPQVRKGLIAGGPGGSSP